MAGKRITPKPESKPPDSLRRGASQAASAAPTLRYGPAGDSAPRLRLRRPGMPERFPFGFATMNDNILYHALAPLSIPRSALPPFSLVSSASFGSARSRPGREAAKRTLDGEDRSDTMKREGKGGFLPTGATAIFPVRQHHRVLNRAGTRTTASGESRNASPVNMT